MVDASAVKASTCDQAEICARLKVAREKLRLTQDGLARAVGGSKRGIQGNEALKQVPGGMVICGLVRLGINANWLLTGEGPMLLADLRQQAPVNLDLERLRLALETAEEGLVAAKRALPPAKKADLVLAVYDLLEEPASTKERVLKLVKLAA